MCSIFGINIDDIELLEEIGIEGMSRGKDATGIATLNNGEFEIFKKDVKASNFDWSRIHQGKGFYLGHTRNTTKGDEKDNYNNHPFISENKDFVLAHNGVISNDITLRKQKDLDKTEIETDSYVIVQLIDLVKYTHKKEKIDIEVVKEVCELLSGSFVLTILTQNKLYLLRHNNPLHIAYNGSDLIYASTKEMIQNSLSESGYKDETSFGTFIGEIDNNCIYEFDLENKYFTNQVEFEAKKSYSYSTKYKGNYGYYNNYDSNKKNKSKRNKSKNKSKKTNKDNDYNNKYDNSSENNNDDDLDTIITMSEFEELSYEKKFKYILCSDCSRFYLDGFGGYVAEFGKYLCFECQAEKSGFGGDEENKVVELENYKDK
ncbi:MAG: class II glutamine amidotransferase [bacterium]